MGNIVLAASLIAVISLAVFGGSIIAHIATCENAHKKHCVLIAVPEVQ